MINAYFFDSKLENGIEDRTYTASDFSTYLGSHITDGVLFDVDTSFKVSIDNNHNYLIAPGKAYVRGRLITNDSNYKIPIRRADELNGRVDGVFLTLDYLKREARLEVKTFRELGSVQTRKGGEVYELCLATAQVERGTTNVQARNLRDTRKDINLCGIADSIFQRLQLKDLIRDICYPVGSIYASRQSTSPETFIGGTWKRVAQGRTLMGVGSGGNNSNNTYGRNVSQNYTVNAGDTGGASSKTLETGNIPKHYHYVAKWTGAAGNRDLNETGIMAGWALAGQSSHPYALRNADRTDNAIKYVGKTSEYGGSSSGSTDAFWTLPPYYGVYMWERTA